MREFWNKMKTNIGIILVPIILLFSTELKLSIKERFYYFIESAFKSSLFLFLYMIVSGWYEDNKVFFVSMAVVLFFNLIVGAKYHWVKKSFDIGEMMIKNIEVLMVVASAYALLTALSTPLNGSIIGEGFKMSIEFISLLYPASKALKNIFILSEGKHPPVFVIKALYNYEKEGKLKDFFDALNGGGIKEEKQD